MKLKTIEPLAIKTLLFFSFLLFLNQVGLSQEPAFYSRVLNRENCTYCYFLSLNVKSKTYSGKVVVQNNDLYSFLSKTKGFDKTQYKEFMKDLLINKKELIISNARLSEDGLFLNVNKASQQKLRISKPNNEIDKIAEKGCAAFVSYYFLGKDTHSTESNKEDCHQFISRQKREDLQIRVFLGADEEALVISKLFEWQILARFDDVLGRLFIDK